MSRALLIQPAIRTGHKARIALSGPTGSGKTFGALIIARELAGPDGKILLIDTERGSASLYSDKFDFETIDWKPPYDPREVASDLLDVSKQYDVVVIDSMTHFWQGEGGTLDIVDAAGARAAGNNYAGWKTGTPAQNSFVESMLQADCHVIATMRSKMEYVLEQGKNGKTAPKKVGMSPIQRDGIEYEFTIGAELDLEHRLLITKSRFADIADNMYPSHQVKDMAASVKEWLDAAPAVNLAGYVLQVVTDESARKALGEAWRATFEFRTSSVPIDQEAEARALIDSFKPVARELADEVGVASDEVAEVPE